ncbi:MAG: DUF4157 domain-containing protein [Hassallia sp. WJT32-NPBG1]|jgi:hypothetical protein|nr:DUF4157 domain-containing protein [Hassallia sp. WJT32-NPBG1]
MSDRIRLGRNKASTSTFSNPSLVSPNTPTLANPIRGFGLPTNNALTQTGTEVSTDQQEAQFASDPSLELLPVKEKPIGHDISRISLRRPQAKLQVGEPGDKYEQEADWMANQVMRMPEPGYCRSSSSKQPFPGHDFSQIPIQPKAQSGATSGHLSTAIRPLVQRQALPEDEADVKPELPVEAAEAQETEEVAPEPEAGREDASQEPPPMEAPDLLEAGEEELVQTKPALSPSTQNSSAETGDGIEQTLTQSKAGGSALSDDVRTFMEPRFGTDFSQVRVHNDGTAVQLNRKLQARAFTHGNDIFFNAGQYEPGSDSGKQLLAHELTHVIQQTGSISNKQVSRKPVETDQLHLQAKQLPTKRSLKDREDESNKDQIPSKAVSAPFNQSARQRVTGKDIADNDRLLSVTQPSEQNGQVNEIKTNPLKPEIVTSKADANLTTNENHTQPHQGSEDAAGKLKGASVELVTDEGAKGAKDETASPAKAAASQATEGTKQPAAMDAVPQNLDRAAQSPTAAVNPLSSANLTTSDSNTQPTPQTGGAAALTAASNAGATVSAAGGSETAEEGEAEGPSEKEIEAVAAGTEGVELPSSDRSEVESALADVGSGGDAGATGGDIGGGGGGGTAIEDPPTPPVPDVSQAEPSQAIASLSQLPPAQIQAGLGGVTTAINSSITQKQAELAANPPQMERPSGSVATKDGAAGDQPSLATKTPKPVEKTPQKEAKSVSPPRPIKLPLKFIGRAASLPSIQGDAEGKVSPGDVQALKASINRMPTRDPGLNVSAGPPPALKLEGDADPNQTNEQKANLEKSAAEVHAQGRQDLAEPMGENAIYPKVPKEILKAETVGGKTGSAESGVKLAGGNTKGGTEDDAISIIAQQQNGQEIQAAVAQAQSQIATQRQEHTAKVAEEKAKSNQEISKIQQENADLQAKEREKTQAEVGQLRSDWNKEQTDLVDKSRKDADAAVSKGRQDVQQKQTQAETQAAAHIEKGNQDAEAERRKGEEKAEAERQKANQEPKGFFGWLADKAKAFFDGIKQAIQAALELARAAVKAAIEIAQKLATEVIEAARKLIVAVIKAIGEALIAIADVLLAAFPKLRDRFRNAIKAVVKAAEAAVNALAETLKKGVQAALNLLGKALDAALKLLEKGYMLAVDLVSKAVQGAISAAKAVVSALGVFAVLIKDIAASPGQWLRNLAAGVMDGIKNHLWTAFQAAVKEWFNQKVDEVLGLGMVVWQMLKQGGIGTAQVGQMAWEGIKAAIPPALIAILIEKLVSMIVPAAGTVMVIIEGLQAAWGTVSRILQAIERFMAFMKAVKTGNSGPQFGAMLAAAGVVLIDFVANWLLKRVRGAASKVGGKIKAIAKKIGDKLKKAVKKVGQKLKGTGKKVGQKLRGGMEKVRDKFGKLKERFFGKKADKDKKGRDKEDWKNKENENRKKQERLDKAVSELQPKVHALLQQGVSGTRLRAQLAFWRIRYRLSRLEIHGQGEDAKISATVNPTKDVVRNLVNKHGENLLKSIRQVGQQLLQDDSIQKRLEQIHNQRAAGRGNSPEDPIRDEPGLGFVAQAADVAGMSRPPLGRPPQRGKIRQPWTIEHREIAGTPVRERQTFSSGPGHIRVEKVGKYHEIVEQWQSIRASTASKDAEIATAMHRFMKTGQLDPKFSAFRQQLAALTRLGAVEMGRSSAQVVLGPRLVELASKEQITGAQALQDLNPMAPVGAVRTASAVSERLGLPPEREYKTQASSERVAQMMKTELDAMTEYLHAKMQIDKPLFENAEQLEKFIEREFKEYLLSDTLQSFFIVKG